MHLTLYREELPSCARTLFVVCAGLVDNSFVRNWFGNDHTDLLYILHMLHSSQLLANLESRYQKRFTSSGSATLCAFTCTTTSIVSLVPL